MATPINPTQITPPRVPFIDERSGSISREWYRFFLSLLTATQTNQETASVSPDTNSLLASYDAMLANLAQTTETAPAGGSETASVDAKVDSLAQATDTAPSAASENDLAAIQTQLQALALTPAPFAASGATGAFTSADTPPKVVTVVNGIIVSIV
jgi:hypothetical protein